ncbi:uncharacterized mitochondrial protein AtMg00810-like [Humulus lupulus]|uniref:uncharacterized mitochondrial protein AtMg00810-like n=1 Tax=Humulus lupulus TaxID=3486 RepID=UPI002B40626C|nr:uncharacterized mitochondrial protein AtMg00810-like [Humulus lupulus]
MSWTCCLSSYPDLSDDLPIALLKAISHLGWHNAMIEEMNALDDNGKLGAKPCSTPMTPNMHLTGDGELFEDPESSSLGSVKANFLLLEGAPGCGIVYRINGHTHINCFSDANWAGFKMDRRSTSGYCIFVGGNLVSWKSKKQNVVS